MSEEPWKFFSYTAHYIDRCCYKTFQYTVYECHYNMSVFSKILAKDFYEFTVWCIFYISHWIAEYNIML